MSAPKKTTRAVPVLVGAALSVACVMGALRARVVHADAPVGRYEITGGTVRDAKTALTWERGKSATTVDFNGAKAYCSGLVLEGGGWRVPQALELASLLDVTRSASPLQDPSAFTATGVFWSSTASVTPDPTWAIYVDLDYGAVAPNFQAEKFFARCVR